MKLTLKDKVLAQIFENCFPNTLDSTIEYDKENNDTFVITGDIEAMWLRDSTNQVWPYLDFINQDQDLKQMIKGIINRQQNSILIDTYANAFMKNTSGKSQWSTDYTEMKPGVFERKYEIDSLAAVLKLQMGYFAQTKDESMFDQKYIDSLKQIINTITKYQKSSIDEKSYSFQRNTNEPTDSLSHSTGFPAKQCGLVRSAFRPSDDACTFQFFIPGNAMLSVGLNQTFQALKSQNSSVLQDLAQQCETLSQEIKNSIYINAIDHDIFSYEIDGYGNHIQMDDANMPSLLSLPLLGFLDKNDPIYLKTRQFLLSQNNPLYFQGSFTNGIGSVHVDNSQKMVWHISLIVQIMTSDDDKEILILLDQIKKTTADTFYMHESFDADNPQKYTRNWFAWANSMFGQMIIQLSNERPHLIFYQEQSQKSQTNDQIINNRFENKATIYNPFL